MKRILLSIAIAVILAATGHDASAQQSIYDFTVKDMSGKEVSMSEYKGKVLLIVNTATQCGFTPQYEDLQALNEKYASKGLDRSLPAYSKRRSGGTGLDRPV